MTDQLEQRILRKFDVHQKLGKGAYGVVWKATHRKTGHVVALKKVFDAFQNATDAQRTYREVTLLRGLKGHPNIISLLGVLRAENNRDLHLVFEFMETDLHIAIRAQLLEQVHKRYIIYQIIKAMKFIHSADIVHRDLKPSNVLLNSACLVKVADFGLARFITETQGSENVLTEHIATRWYRAPEILLGSTSYTKAVDMWSIGCILAELLLGKALFNGSSTLNQLEKIVELLGYPTRQDVVHMDSSLSVDILSQLSSNKKKRFSTVFGDASEEAIDLVRGLLLYDPTKRLTAEEALSHPYLREFHDPLNETVCTKEINVNDSNTKYSVRFYQEVLYSMDKQERSQSPHRIYQEVLKRNGTPTKMRDVYQERENNHRPVECNNCQHQQYQSRSREKLNAVYCQPSRSPLRPAEQWQNRSAAKYDTRSTSPLQQTKSYMRYQQANDRMNKLYTESTCSGSSKVQQQLERTHSKKKLF